jgi:PAS domain S-box-containing protein
MKIKGRLNLTSYASLGMVLFMIPFLVWSFWELSRGDRNTDLTSEMEKIALERTVLRDQFIMIGGKRPRIQWESKTEDFRGLLQLARERFTKEKDIKLLEEIEKHFNATANIFDVMVKNHESATGAGEDRVSVSETEKRLFSQIVLKAYALIDSLGLLHKSAHATATIAHERVIIFLILFGLVVILSNVSTTFAVTRILTRRLAMLHEGTGIIGAGNLDHRIVIKGTDELWDLARATNEMAEKLRESHTSLENLRSEVAERNRIAVAFRESEERYRGLFENMLEGFAYCKMVYENGEAKDFIYLSVNRAFTILTGLKDVVGKRVSEVIPGIRETDAGLLELYSRVSLTGHPEKIEIFVEALKMWFAISVYSPGREHFVAVFDVITERKRAEEALRKHQDNLGELVKKRTVELEGAVGELNFEIEARKIIEAALKNSEEKYRNLYNSMKSGIVMVDMVGNILECNAAYQAMIGYSEEEVRNLTYQALTPEKWHSLEAALVQEQILPRGFSDEYEKEYIRKNGEVFPVSIKTWLIKDEGGGPRGMWALVGDITERKRAEKEIAKLNEELKLQIRDLEDANKELGSFSYSVSHDLKAPLRGIDGFSKIVLDEYGDKLDPEGRRFLRIIRNNVAKMNQLIEDLLSFSRFGRREICTGAVQMKTLAQEAFEEVTSAQPTRNIRFEVKPLPEAHADQPMIWQVLINLLSNATKFTRPRDLADIEIGGWSANGEDVYYVKDNGVGFDMTYIDKLFGIFQRLHSDSEFEGTGVGLAIVQRIIHRHGGRVWAEGKVDEGATFYFTLPTDSGKTGEA